MRTRRSLITSPQLKQKLKWQYKVVACTALALVVGIGVFFLLNFGNNDKSLAETAADETGITSYIFTPSQSGSLEDMGFGTTTLIGSGKSDVASDVAQIGFDFVFM